MRIACKVKAVTHSENGGTLHLELFNKPEESLSVSCSIAEANGAQIGGQLAIVSNMELLPRRGDWIRPSDVRNIVIGQECGRCKQPFDGSSEKCPDVEDGEHVYYLLTDGIGLRISESAQPKKVFLLYSTDGTSSGSTPECVGVALSAEDAERWKADNRDKWVSRSWYPKDVIKG